MKAGLYPGAGPVLGRVVPGSADLAGVPVHGAPVHGATRVPGQLLSIAAWHVLHPTALAPAGDGYFKP